MPEFLSGGLADGVTVGTLAVAFRLVAALAAGFLVSWIYRATRSPADAAPSFQTTLVLLAVLIAMVTQVIGESVARAFSLVGALSIVRFRTVVRDTEDTAYVIFAVVVGMAVGASSLWIAVIGIAVVGMAATLRKSARAVPVTPSAETTPELLLLVRVTLAMDLDQVTAVCSQHVEALQFRSVSTVKQGAALEAVYEIQLRAGGSPMELVRELNRVEGVQSVEVQRSGIRRDVS